MSNDGFHPLIQYARSAALSLFVITTWGVAIFFVIDFWPWLRQIDPQHAILAVAGTLLAGLLTGLVWIAKLATGKQILQFYAVMFFFIALAVLYSYVGMRLGLEIREWIGWNKISPLPATQ